MHLEKKESFILISVTETKFSHFCDAYLDQNETIKNNNIILILNNDIEVTKDVMQWFYKVSKEKNKNGTSFVVVSKTISIDDFSEDVTIVPTLQEAKDIIDIETIERELGFNN